jgi:hypothetical protein
MAPDGIFDPWEKKRWATASPEVKAVFWPILAF